jgi:hypothetical protein
MVKDWSRVAFLIMLDMAPHAFLTKLVPLSIGCRHFSPGNAEND